MLVVAIAGVAGTRTGPPDRQVLGELDGQVDDPVLAHPFDQPWSQRFADDAEGPDLGADAPAVFRRQLEVDGSRRRELVQIPGPFRPEHSVFQTGAMGFHGPRGRKRAHAGTVDACGENPPASHVVHGLGVGPRPGRFLSRRDLGHETQSLGQRLEVLVVVAAPEEDHVAGAQGPVAPLPVLDVLLADQGTVPDGGVVQQVAHVDDAGLPQELPDRHSFGRDLGDLPGNRAVSGRIELGPGVLVDGDDVAVVGAARADLEVVVDMEVGKDVRPVHRVFLGDQQGEVQEPDVLPRSGDFAGRCQGSQRHRYEEHNHCAPSNSTGR